VSSTDATVIGGTEVPPGDAPAIDGVTIERELGRGGMGAVWLGRQTYLDRRVAVKALTLAGDEVFANRFRREARILAGLAHPHIVACHQAGMAPDGRPFLVMEFVDGPDLKKHVAANGPLAPADAARLVAEVAEGLRHAHAQGIIHRDVKPENVLLAKRPDGSWTAKLADLGLARPSQAVKGQDLTAAGQILGTPSTMAPEQFDDPDSVDQRADIYGLGCVLHHALTGEAAFTGRSFAELVASKVHGPPPDPAKRRPGVPRELSALCMAMLSRDRAQRPDYDAVIAALRRPLSKRSVRPLFLLGVLGVLVAAIVIASLSIPSFEANPEAARRAAAAAEAKRAAAAQAAAASQRPVAGDQQPVASNQRPAASGLPALAAPLALFGADFDKRLAGWSIADPIAWGPLEDVEGFPIAGRSGEIVLPLKALPGRITGTVTLPEDATHALIGLRDADGRTTGLRLLPLNGLIASLVSLGVDGGDLAGAGSATKTSREVQFTLTIAGGRLSAVLRDAAVAKPMVIDLPAPPVAVVLSAEGKQSTLFQDLRAEP
jgi:hypothetical protein